MLRTPNPRSRPAVLRQVTELPTLPMSVLMERWRELYGTEPPPHNKKYLVNRLAYRIQELAFGGVSEATLTQLGAELDEAGYNTFGVRSSEKPSKEFAYRQYAVGTVLRREWSGMVYEVTVVRNGFLYEGKVYRHLTPIAKLITGQHQSGNTFFGIKPIQRKGTRP